MKQLRQLFENNRRWAKEHLEKDPDYFKKLAKGQNPSYLWIGCSDSRVNANEIVDLEHGNMFVHRNIGNIFPHTDFNCLSVLEYAVDYLQVRHVIVCGHYGCGGVGAAMTDRPIGLADNWLRNIRDVYTQNRAALESIENPKKRFNRLVELNVVQQVANVCHTSIVQAAWARGQFLCVHGWVYDLEKGLLRDLECCISSQSQISDIYQLKHFSHTLDET